MDPVLRAALSSWELRLDVILVLATAGAIYTLGWRRLRGRTGGRNRPSPWSAAAPWRPVAYLGGLFLLGIALMSPIDVLGSQLFLMHMVQHVLLVMIVPPLLLLANPMPFWLWGMPDRARLEVGRLFRRGGRLRRGLKTLTGRGHVWLYFVIAYWGWHDPTAYGLALENSFVHDLEHISFVMVSTLFWWHVIPSGPHIHTTLSPLARAAYVLSAFPPNMLAGLAIAFAREPLYEHYEYVPRIFGLSVMDDQRIAGVIMWVPGSMMYMIAALIFVGRWLKQESEKPVLPKSTWDNDQALAAPGWKE